MKTHIPIIILILVFTSQVSGQVPDSVKFRSLEPYDFHLEYLKEDKAVLIDVREFFEFKGKRIKDAINIPSTGNLEYAADTINKDRVLFLYCTTGYRSKNVARKFYDQGSFKIFSLEGGIVAWKKDGFPFERKKLHLRR